MFSILPFSFSFCVCFEARPNISILKGLHDSTRMCSLCSMVSSCLGVLADHARNFKVINRSLQQQGDMLKIAWLQHVGLGIGFLARSVAGCWWAHGCTHQKIIASGISTQLERAYLPQVIDLLLVIVIQCLI